jgi:hypothetical protein
MEAHAMLKRSIRSWAALVGTGALLAGGLAAAEEIYTWRTQDGGYAFTDDEKAIPPRYRDRVKIRHTEGLEGYRRFTPKDDPATQRYEERLAARLEHLRALNGSATAPGAGSPPDAAAPAPATPREQITLRTGQQDAPGIDITTASDGEPIVVERMWIRPEGKAVTQNVQVTRRGGKPIAIVKPRRTLEWNISDIVDEEELEEWLLEEHEAE